MVAYLKAGSQVRTYSDYIRATQEAEKEDSMELSQGPGIQTTDNPPKPRATSFFPLRKLKSNQPIMKVPAVHLEHLEEEDARSNKDEESDDPGGIEGVTKKFMVCLARAAKDAQTEEKCCYHCSSPEHFICNCPLVDFEGKYTVKWQGRDGNKEGSPDPSDNSQHIEEPPDRGSQGVKLPQQTPFLNPDPFQCWHGVKNVGRVRINGESCMALLDNGTQINTITPKYVNDHSLQMGLITDLLGAKIACMGLGNAYTRPLGYVIIGVQVDGVQGYDEDQIALVIPDLSNFAA